MPELVTIPISFFEIEIDYKKPDIRLLADRAPFVQGVFEALLPWSPKLDGIEILTTGAISQQGVTLKLPVKNISFFVGANFCRFSRNAVAWTMAEETLTIFETSVSALERLTGVERGIKRTSLGMHLQMQTASFRDILRPFLASSLMALNPEPFSTMAAVVKWSGRKITLDGSGSLANGLFLKLEREFESAASNEAIAQQLWKDEVEMFELLGVKEATNESVQ